MRRMAARRAPSTNPPRWAPCWTWSPTGRHLLDALMPLLLQIAAGLACEAHLPVNAGRRIPGCVVAMSSRPGIAGWRRRGCWRCWACCTRAPTWRSWASCFWTFSATGAHRGTQRRLRLLSATLLSFTADMLSHGSHVCRFQMYSTFVSGSSTHKVGLCRAANACRTVASAAHQIPCIATLLQLHLYP